MRTDHVIRWTYGQYALFRALLGAYLLAHFAGLVAYGREVFSNEGMLADGELSPLFGILPNVLSLSDAPWAVTVVLLAGAVGGIAIVAGRFDRLAGVGLAYLLACLYARNPLIANPSLPVVGWLLLMHAALPRPKCGDIAAVANWRLPQTFFVAAWILLALSYTHSGYTKLFSPSWVSGDAVAIVLENPLARDHWLRQWLLAGPDWILRAITWGILVIEIVFAPLALFRCLRPWLWGAMLTVQVGFLSLLNFADLTAPMLLIHLLTLEPRWLNVARERTRATLYYDGDCALCHGLVRFALREDQLERLRFAPLQAEPARKALAGTGICQTVDTIVLQCGDGRLAVRSDAVVGVLRRLGGIWRLIGGALALVPRPARDAGYDLIGRHRIRMFGSAATACPIVPHGLAERFVDEPAPEPVASGPALPNTS